MHDDALSLPVDPTSAAALAARGLRMAVLDPEDAAARTAWVQADARGFHDAAPTEEFLEELAVDAPLERTVGVYDDGLDDPSVPVATVAAWPAAVTVPGGELDAWAISSVSVAPTHRRRGIARAMLEAELRAAVAADLPLAILTVSEATIYSRYGFGPATWSTDFTIDARRAGWVGAEAPGRLQLVDRASAMATAETLLVAARRGTVGDVEVVGHRFPRLFGAPSEPAEQRKRRFVRYDDERGVARGLAVYRLIEDAHDFSSFTVEVTQLVSTTDDAYRALWRFLLTLDLVATVKAPLRTVDEPVRWLVRDPRMIHTTDLREHLWVRVLDPVVALGARSYGGPGRLGLRVTDPLGFADGAFTVDVDAAGRAAVVAGEPVDGPVLDVPIEALGSLYLGGASAVTLAAAGRLAESAPGDAAAADRLLRSSTPPALMTWF